MRYGLDFHRIHLDSIGTGGDLGSFTFSGFATENPQAQACNALTDPQGCKQYGDIGIAGGGSPDRPAAADRHVTAGLNKIYLRGNSWDWFAQDDWRAKSNLTFNFGVRWEYFSPYSEKYNRLVNLNLTGSGANGLADRQRLRARRPCRLVRLPQPTRCSAHQPRIYWCNPDKALYSPRVSIAWQPKFKWTKSMVVRSGYGINYNTGQYSRFASKMSFQQPFAITQTNPLSTPEQPDHLHPHEHVAERQMVYKNSNGLQLLHPDHPEQLRCEPELPPGHGPGL